MLFSKTIITVSLSVTMLMSLVGCGDNANGIEADYEDNDIDAPVIIEDALGREVSVTSYPDRIISLAPSHTEIIYALELDEKLVGVTEYCDYPPEAVEVENVGGYVEPSLEIIIEMEPDLILGARHHESLLEYLEPLDINVYLHEPVEIDELWSTIYNIGLLTGVEEKAANLSEELKSQIEEILDITSSIPVEEQPTVFFEVWHDPLTAAGGNTLIDELIELAGGKNIAGNEEGYPQFSLEILIEENPQVYLATTGSMSSPGDLTERPGWDALEGTRANIFQDENIIYRCGPRITEGLEKMASYLYPELFD